MDDNKFVDVEVTIEGQALSRRYWMTDGIIQKDMKVEIQDMIDAVLEEKGDIFDYKNECGHEKNCDCGSCHRYLSKV